MLHGFRFVDMTVLAVSCQQNEAIAIPDMASYHNKTTFHSDTSLTFERYAPSSHLLPHQLCTQYVYLTSKAPKSTALVQ